MKTIKLLLLAVLFIGFASCDDDDDIQLIEVSSETVVNLHATYSGGINQQTGMSTPISGEFTKYNFATGMTTTSTTEWDIAFRGLDIIINGGTSSGLTDEPARTGVGAAYIASMPFANVTDVDTSLFVEDSATGFAIDSWYDYDPIARLISATAGKTLVIKTNDGKYAKVRIISYYKDAPATPDAFMDESRYYTFDFVYQPNDGVLTF